jgi:hypothetical protein
VAEYDSSANAVGADHLFHRGLRPPPRYARPRPLPRSNRISCFRRRRCFRSTGTVLLGYLAGPISTGKATPAQPEIVDLKTATAVPCWPSDWVLASP